MMPIMITTYNRPNYLRTLMRSLELSDYGYGGDVHIFDDHSDEKNKLELLDELTLMGYRTHYNFANLGTVLNTIPNIDRMFNWHYSCSYIAVIQDDVVLSKDWYGNTVHFMGEFTKRSNAAILSIYNRVTNTSPEKENRIQVLESGHPGGVAYCITRRFWENYTKHYDINDYGIDGVYEVIKGKEHRCKNDVDYKLCMRARKLNGCIAYLVNSIAQHTGDISTLHNRNMSPWRAKNFIGDIANGQI